MSDENEIEIIKDKKVAVLLPLIFRKAFDYKVPDGMDLRVGDYVRVPFGKKSVYGVVWGAAEGGVEEKKLKTIEALCVYVPAMRETIREFLEWVAWYTLAPLGQVLKMAIPLPEVFKEVASDLWQVAESVNVQMTPARARIIAYLSDGVPRSKKDIETHAKVSASVIREFIKAGGLREAKGKKAVTSENTLPAISFPLSASQEQAARFINEKFGKGFSTIVLDGVTGSGKTEVYFDAIAHALQAGKQALVLLPEIALSVQWLQRFEKRFGFKPEIWHSSVGLAKKRKSWVMVAEGRAQVVVGARSALFLPFESLGLIIVDEEHDASYKQEEGVIYHARDMAVARSRFEKAPVVLVSATPSLETEFNMDHKRYERVHLHARHNDADMPEVKLIDMRSAQKDNGKWISEPLKQALVKTLAAKKQAMVFMNRRGYAPLMLCRACGHRFQCPHCTSWLVLHKNKKKLMCHHCGYTAHEPSTCPECKKENSLIPYGPGVERIAEELKELFPQVNIQVLTSDFISEDNTNSADIITEMIKGHIDILVGTQMVAKGHHFAGLALVGVIDADMGLAGGDLRAGERTYQLLHQLSGRAGREQTKGEVYLQTYMPEHPVMQALMRGVRDDFMQLEARMREDASMPPYGKLASIIVEGGIENEVVNFARSLVGKAQAVPVSQASPLILGPAPAPLMRLKNRYRYRILVKAARSFPMQQFLSDWILPHKVPSSLKLKIDVEPYSFV